MVFTFVVLSMRFDKSSYTVNEDEGEVEPVLKLSEPSPCCITVYAEVTSRTGSTAATGKHCGFINYKHDPI